LKPKRKESKFLSRLSGPGLFSLRFFGWSYLILFIPQVAFDVIAYESSSWLWLPIWTFGHLLIAFCGYFIRFLWLDKRLAHKPSAALNISIAALLGSIRVTFIGYISFQLALAPDFNLTARIIAGAILGATLFVVLGSVLSSRRDYQASLGKLLATQRQLENMRRARCNEVAEIQNQWEISTREVIEPKIEEIARLVKRDTINPTVQKGIVTELRFLLDNQIKPLSARLKSTSSALANRKTFKGVSPLRLFTIPDRVNPDLAINPFLQFLVLTAAIPFALYVFEGPEWIPLGFEIAVVTSLFLFLNKIAVAKRKSIPTKLGIAALFALTLAQTAIGFFLLQLSGLPSSTIVPVVVLQFFAITITTVFYGLAITYEYNQVAFLKTLSRNNKRLARELALLNQRLWVEKREWALRIHGSVQASLTASLVRLSGKGAPSKEQLAKVREHLSQASNGLKASAVKPIDLRASLKVIQKTWGGIAKIKINLKSAPAQQVLVDDWAGVIANEIIKEAVSNSVTHGKADLVEVNFEDPTPGFVQIIVQDNGRGLSPKSSSGLGSQILDETAFPWSLHNQPTGGTILKAQIAVAPKKRNAKTK
jgi:signal transduction histidine kinase